MNSYLLTVFRDVSNTVAAIAEVLVLLALASEVTVLVALEALFAASGESTVPVAAASAVSPSSAGSALGTFPREVAHSAAFVARARTHVL